MELFSLKDRPIRSDQSKIRIRFIAEGDIECPADVLSWKMMDQMKRFRNRLGKPNIIYDLGRRIPRKTRLEFTRV